MTPDFYKHIIRVLILCPLVFCMTSIISCTNKELNTRKNETLTYPNYFPKPKIPTRNPQTKAGVLLGKRLFFDKTLSASKQVSCASCHKPELSFSDGKALSSLGVSGNILKRNTPALINLAWMNELFWDGGVHNLESLPFAALTSPDEMGADLFMVSKNLNQDKTYKKMFFEAFAIDSISSAYISRALAQYQRTLIYNNSKYDAYLKGKRELSMNEIKGLEVFEDKCASCHIPPLFTDNSFHNIGLDTIFPQRDLNVLKGRARITQDSLDLGKFKTPSLRNLKFTVPYMHDGRFATLGDALNHYQKGIAPSLTLDSVLLDFSIDHAEKKFLIAFLNTLNDEDLISEASSLEKN